LEAKTIRQEAALAAERGDTRRLLALAKEYTRFLSPMFHLIPWDERVILGNDSFMEAFRAACAATGDFSNVTPETIAEAICQHSSALVVFRTIAGYRTQELAYALQLKLGVIIGEQALKKMELEGKPATLRQRKHVASIAQALHAAVEGSLLPRPGGANGFVDRQSKFDTKRGWQDVPTFAKHGVPYATVLYERYLGRPFAYVVDALSRGCPIRS
jgi:hypothetical protein